MKTFLVIIFSVIPWDHIVAQEVQPPVNIQSPNAASLGKYGDTPVSYYTGSPNINIPLHTLKARDIELDIALQYDASGIQIDRHPGWVGMNWSLDAGGVITRSAQGNPDELSISNYLPPVFSYFEITNDGRINNVNLKDSQELIDGIALWNFGASSDFQPDIFSFNFMGISGKFFLGSNNEWKVISDSNIEVIFDYYDNSNYISPSPFDMIPNITPEPFPKVIKGFKLRDDQGNVYTFGSEDGTSTNAIEFSLPFWNQIGYSPFQPYPFSPWIANSWYLTKVEDKFGNELFTLNYVRRDFIAEFFSSSTYSEKLCRSAGGMFNFKEHLFDPGGIIGSKVFALGSLISPVYLNSINTMHGESVSFLHQATNELDYEWNISDFNNQYNYLEDAYVQNGDPNYPPLYYLQSNNPFAAVGAAAALADPIDALKWYKLDYMVVNNIEKKIEFLYNDDDNPTTERLNLLGLEFYGNEFQFGSTDHYSYSFTYNNFDQLPPYLSHENDHWGYYRGAPYIVDKNNYQIHYSSRQPNPNYLTNGMLSAISYPTGGSTFFEFEPHDYSKIVNDEHNGFLNESGIAGGVRIKKITDYDGNQKVVRDFKYVSSYSSGGTESSGILAYKPHYYWDQWENIIGDQGEATLFEKVFSTNTLIPQSNSFGTHIEYGEVTEERKDGSYTSYFYTTNEDYMDELPIGSVNLNISPYQKFNDLSMFRGKSKEIKNYNGDNYLVRKISYAYRNASEILSSFGLATNVGWGLACGPTMNDEKYYKGDAWKIYYKDFDNISEEVITYFGSDFIAESISLLKVDYPLESSNRYTREISKIDSKVKEFKTSFKYAFDLQSETYMSELLQSGRAGEVIKTEKFMDQTPIGVKHVKYKLEDSMYVPHIIETSTTDYSALEDEVIYDEYDAEGNVVQYHKANDLNNVIVWGYDNRFPVVNIANAVFTEVESDPAYSWIQNITDKQSLLNQFDNLRTNLSSAMMTAYTYDNHGGITSITSPTGQTQHFEYDDFNRLQLTRDLDGNILVKNGYRYTDEKYFAMSDILGVRTNLEQGELNMFSVAVVGGSGQYNYDWRFYNEGNLIHTSNSSFVNKVMDYAGITTIICEVTDQTTNERVSTSSENIYVTEVPYEFSSINNINKGVEAYLESPIAGDVTFTLLNQATSANSTYYIGSQVYTPGYGSQDVTVSFNGQTKVYVKIEIPDGLSGAFAQLEIKSHSHNGAIIGTQKIISVSIQ